MKWKAGRVAVFAILTGCQSTAALRHQPNSVVHEVSRAAFNGTSEPFTPHQDYVAISFPFAPLKPLFAELNSQRGPLLNRGESHITVLTPPEFAALGGRVPMAQINQLVEEKRIQMTRPEPVCIGEGRAVVDGKPGEKPGGKPERTYFVVVKAPELFAFRREIARLNILAGGAPSSFDAEHFYPHITLGFSKTDLFEQNGVIKDERSCLDSLTLAD